MAKKIKRRTLLEILGFGAAAVVTPDPEAIFGRDKKPQSDHWYPPVKKEEVEYMEVTANGVTHRIPVYK